VVTKISLEKTTSKGGKPVALFNFEAVSQLCSDPDYKHRLTFVATAKVPTLRLRLVSGIDSLRQCKVLVQKLRSLSPTDPA
jgi:hypothetical protein